MTSEPHPFEISGLQKIIQRMTSAIPEYINWEKVEEREIYN
jgi:hypothetical protein